MPIASNASHLRDREISSVAPSNEDVLVWNDTTKKWEPDSQSGGTTPTGTGFRHVTAGVEDSATKLVENADVASDAAIGESKVAFDNSTGHSHDGSDSTKIDHTDLLTIGTNTHATIDTFIASKGAASGICPLNASTKIDGDYLAAATSTKRGGVPATNTTGTKVLYDNDTWAEPPGASGGEANTASNVGGGVGLFKQKTGVNLEFKTMNSSEFSQSSDITSVLAVAEAKITFDTGSGHAHTGSDSAQVDHTDLLSIGTNTHATIDTFIASKASASGLASLDSSSKVVQDPANATATPTASKIPIADAGASLDGWISKIDVMGGMIARSSDTSLIWSFITSNQARLFNNTGGAWELCQLSSEPSASSTGNDMGSTQLTYGKNYDVFLVYSSATAATLAFAPWATDTARYAAWVTSHGYKIGDRVSESGSYYACVEAHTSDTFSTDLAAGKWVLLEGTGDNLGLGIKDGVPIYANSGSWRGYRYIGVVRLRNDTGAKFTNSSVQRFIANRYNHDPLLVSVSNGHTGDTSEQVGSSWVSWESNGDYWKLEFVLERTQPVNLFCSCGRGSGDTTVSVSIGIDTKVKSPYGSAGDAYYISTLSAQLNKDVSPGYHTAWPIAAASNTTAYVYYYYASGGVQIQAAFGGRIG